MLRSLMRMRRAAEAETLWTRERSEKRRADKTKCVDMKAGVLFLLACVCHSGVFIQTGRRSVFVVLQQQHTLACHAGGCGTVLWRKISSAEDSPETVAECQKQDCTIKENFQEKFTIEEGNLTLKSAKYNDLGTYVCSCNDTESDIILDVLVPDPVPAAESETISLRCHGDNRKDVTWLYDNIVILHQTMNGSTKLDKRYEGRISLDKDSFKNANFSLIITGVRKTDAGLYRCFVNDETIKGLPHAHMLHVNESNSNDAGTLLIYERVIMGLVIVGLIVLVLVLICRKTTTTPTTATQAVQEGENDTETSRMLTERIAMMPHTDESQSTPTDSRPVQESESESDYKPSSITPF